ncbi:MAG: PQQ-binding-like beta-propeller repeat protein [Terracidiphilus sp.]
MKIKLSSYHLQIVWLVLYGALASAQSRSTAGQELFTQHCAICHGATGAGTLGPSLSNSQWQAETTDQALQQTIREGVPGTSMPSFKSTLTANQIMLLTRHIRSLRVDEATGNKMAHAGSMVTQERLSSAAEDTNNWLMYGHDYTNQRFSPLAAVRRDNIRRLVPVWSFQTGVPDGLESTPLFVDGVIYLTTAWNHVFAIDAHTGQQLWHYRRLLPKELHYCCGPVNRGPAIAGGLLYLNTLDSHLVALDLRTGEVRWDVEVGKVQENASGTSPPLVVGDKVLVGIAGGDLGCRGFVDAYQAETGKRLWRFYTVSEPNGGGATWLSGSYDPDLNLVYWGTGNPYPAYDGDARPGDNLYADSVIALDPATGRLQWHYQFTPHDAWDYDGTNEMVLANLHVDGRTVKGLLHADRNGYFYALDRADGHFLFAKPFVRVTWSKGFASGRPILDPKAIPTINGVTVCPGAAGGKEWNPMAYSPVTGLVYVPAIENCAIFTNYGIEARRQGLPPGPSGFSYLPNLAYGKLVAVRAQTGEISWEIKSRSPMASGMLATAGNLVFTGDAEGYFHAYDAVDGKPLWSYQTGSGIRGAPIAYRLDGKEYIAVASGMSGAVGGYTGEGAPWLHDYRSGGTLFVFALFEQKHAGVGKEIHGSKR